MSRCVRRVQRYPRLYLTTRVRGGWTSAIFLELLFFADIHSYKFGMVRMDHTSSRWFDLITYIFTGDRRSEGAICTRLMRFKSIEPHWPCTEPYSTTSLRGIQGVQGALCTSSRKFKHSEPHRTTSMKSFFTLVRSGWTSSIFLELLFFSNIHSYKFRMVQMDHTSSRWFDLIACIFTGDRRSWGAICTSLMRFKRTSLTLYWTLSNYICFGYTRCAGCTMH